MCGIAGIFNIRGQPVANARERILQMTKMLTHRGPDSQDIYCSPDNGCALGYTRLAIVDPTNITKQPLETSDGKAVLSFNGEIYNYLEVRERLEKKGVHFKTRMDTEVLLEGLYREGEQFLDALDGMWAFAYYDVPHRRLFLSRDLMGERHIFYRLDKERCEFIFASEVAPILADGEQSFVFDQEAVVTALRFFAAPPGRTLLKGIQRMHAGHSIRLEAGSPMNEYRYRKLHPEKWFDFFSRTPSLDAVIEQFETMFHKACVRRIPLDVPFASTLSGGLDSTLICAFASDLGKRRITTLYGESSDALRQQRIDELDEYSASKFTSAKFNTNHLYIKMNDEGCVPVLQHIAENGFDGSIDPGIAPFEMLARHTRANDRKVILISDGPDEFLGGYPVDRRAYTMDCLKAAHPLRHHALRMLSKTSAGTRALQMLGYGQFRVSPFTSYHPFRFIPVHESTSGEALRNVVPEEYVQATSRHYGTIDPVYREILPYLDYTQMRALSYASQSLPDHFNLRTDKAFLHASVECRLPYQAPEMAEFLIAMPARFRFGDGRETKHLLRKIVERRVGPEIAHRSKYGFSVPLLHTPIVRDAMRLEETLRSTSLFDAVPFREGAREFILRNGNEKLRWPFFVLAKTYDRLRSGNFS